ncbi:unnamed protein product [Phyllotreta striolata]|uniref:Uncharacterized protein n=1 Tax=Phyllotreta striolata TaxID=444603 RepID=A0A9N9TI44_PHYSR|nr:unnamed protein product [Phyllotreta striolata]
MNNNFDFLQFSSGLIKTPPHALCLQLPTPSHLYSRNSTQPQLSVDGRPSVEPRFEHTGGGDGGGDDGSEASRRACSSVTVVTYIPSNGKQLRFTPAGVFHVAMFLCEFFSMLLEALFRLAQELRRRPASLLILVNQPGESSFR